MSASVSPTPPVARPPSRWRLSDLAGGLALLLLGYALLLGVLVGASVALGVTPEEDQAGALLADGVTLLLEAWIGVVVWLIARRRGIGGADLGLDLPVSWRWVGRAVAGAYASLIAYGLAVMAVERLTGADLRIFKQGNGIPDLPANTSAVWFVFGVSVMALAPLSEELFFRGFLFRAVQGRAGLVTGLLVSALAFSAFHLNAGVVLPFFAIGLIFAWAYHASGSLWTPIAAHTIFNTISFVATLAGVGS